VSSLGFNKSLRLLTSSDFQAVFDDAPFRASHKHFLILARPSAAYLNSGSQAQLSCTPLPPRLGLVIAKKNIRLAVQRNRLKRLIRETFRLKQEELAGLDIIVLARRGMDEQDNQQLIKQLNQQWQRIIKKARKAARESKTLPCAG